MLSLLLVLFLYLSITQHLHTVTFCYIKDAMYLLISIVNIQLLTILKQ